MWLNTKFRKLAYRYAPRIPFFDRKVHLMRFMHNAGGASPSTDLSFRDKLYRKVIGDELDDLLVRATTDRETAKSFINGAVIKDIAIPSIAVLRSEEEIDTFDFPRDTAVRMTHGHVAPVILSDMSEAPRALFKEWLKRDYYHETRERNYKGLRPGILVEPYLRNGSSPLNIVASCYDGQVSLFHHLEYTDGARTRKRRYYTPDWSPLEFSIWDPVCAPVAKPKNLKNLIKDCAAISEPFEIVGIEAWIYPDGQYFITSISHLPDGNGARILPASAQEEFNARFFRFPPYDKAHD